MNSFPSVTIPSAEWKVGLTLLKFSFSLHENSQVNKKMLFEKD